MVYNENTKEENYKKPLRSLIIFRVIIISLFLGLAIFITIKNYGFPISQNVLYLLYLIIISTFIFSIAYSLMLKFLDNLRFNIYLQLVIDVILITLLVYLTGSVRSNYSVIYTLVIIYSVIFLGRKGGFIVASAASISYGLLLDLEFYKLLPSISSLEHDYNLSVGDVFVRILVHILSFYVLAYVSSIVVEQEKKTRSLLAEKESEFDQLDLLFRSIIESVDAGVMTINLQGRIKTFNRAAQEITGFPLKKVENRLVEDIFPELATFFSQENSYDQISKRKEVIITGEKNNKINLGCSTSPLKDKNAKQIGNIIFFQNLTEIKRMEESLEKSKTLALIGEMAAGLAHEMRNPLASITGSIQLLQQGLNLDETDKRLMQIILRGKDQLDNFVRDFLLLASPIPLSRELVDIKKIAEEVLENVELSNNMSNAVKIVKVFEEGVGIFANKEQVRQVVYNLVINALQAMKEGGVLSVEIKKQKLNDEDNYVEIIVKDTGCGIDENDLKKIFEPFFTNKEKGTGLGLAIVSRFVDGYNGKIKVESVINEGTTFIVSLPGKNDEHMQSGNIVTI
jgi:two-component system sensor histidine kinase PilS (NtrC family)